MILNQRELDEWPTLWSCHKQVERYVQSMRTASRGQSPWIEFNSIDAFLMYHVVDYYVGSPTVIDLATEATQGASIIFWKSQPKVSRIVSPCASNGKGDGDWRSFLRLTLEELDSAGTVHWVDPALEHLSSWEALNRELKPFSPLILSFSSRESDSTVITSQLEGLFSLSEDTLGFIFPLGKTGEGALLNAALQFCSAKSAFRLVAMREVSPFFSSSRLGLIYRRSNTRIPAVLERIYQLYDGNLQFLRLLKDAIDTAVVKNEKPGYALQGNRDAPAQLNLRIDYGRIRFLSKFIPRPVKQYLKEKLFK